MPEEIAAHVSDDEALSLVNYTCEEFLADAAAVEEGARLLKSMMMIAWATGYAAAQQPETARADPKAIQLIAATLGDVCRRNPSQEAAKISVAAIQEFTQELGH